MRKVLKWIAGGLVVIVLAGCAVAAWKSEEITRLLAVNSLFDEDRILNNFSNMDRLFLTTPVSRGNGDVVAFPKGDVVELTGQGPQWIKDRNITSLLVLRRGEIVYENYYLGTGAEDRRIGWSLAKSYLSALLGILLEEGAIAALDDPVTRYAPSLKGTAYDGASIRNVLQMASGVVFDEDYLEYSSDINRMGRTVALGGTLDGFTQELTETFAKPGETWRYVSIDSHVIGMVIRGATGRNMADLLSEKIISKLGQEQDAYYLTDGDGVAFVLGGLNLTTRDYARFGQMILQGGRWNGQQIVPKSWIDASTVASAPTPPGATGYGYHWWMPKDARPSEFMARGVYGQYIFIDRDDEVVIVATAADRSFRQSGVTEQNVEMFRTIIEATR